MADDQRIARHRSEPDKDGAAGTDRWADYLDWMRSTMISRVTSLSVDEQRTTRLPSAWTPIELLSHVLHMEQRWFVWGFLGEWVAEPWGDWNVDEPWRADDADDTGADARWAVPDDVTADQLAVRLTEVGARTRAVLREFPLDTPGTTGGRFGDDPPTLEWICFHVLAEYARHAGHLDIAAELGDTGE